MTGSSHAAFTVGGISIVGGLYAFYKKRSMPSLVGSLIVGGGLITGGWLINNGEAFEGHSLAVMSSFILGAVGAARYAKTQKPMPGMPMLVVGGLSTAYHLQKTYEWK